MKRKIKRKNENQYDVMMIGTVRGEEYYEVRKKIGTVFFANRTKKGNLKLLKKYKGDALQFSETDEKGKKKLLLVKVTVSKVATFN